MKVIINPKAEKSIAAIAEYIREKGYPETAESYLDRMKEFAHSLTVFPEKYALCRQKRFSFRSFRCAVFESNYIFVYKAVREKLIIYNVIHCKRLE